jgi:hypothetical protein
MLSKRIPASHEPNAWAAALASRRAAGGAVLDLAEFDPTRTGLGGADTEVLSALADPRGARHSPDPRGLRGAREAVAAYYAGRGLAVDPDALVLTTGTSESYAHLFRLLCDPGDRVLVPAPSYPLFEPLADLESVRLGRYRLAYDGRWHLDLDSLARAAPGARAVVLVQPNHPTGTCLDGAEWAEVERMCLEHDLSIVSDEVFGDFAWDGRASGLPSATAVREAPAFVLSGLSKVCGLPQLKLGWIALAGARHRAERARGLEWIADLFLSVGTPVQHALPRLFVAGEAFRGRALARIAANRTRLAQAVARAPSLGVLRADGGWVAVLRVPDRRSDEEWALALLARGVVVHPGHFYDFDRDGHLVVSLIVEPATFDAALRVVEEVVESAP